MDTGRVTNLIRVKIEKLPEGKVAPGRGDGLTATGYSADNAHYRHFAFPTPFRSPSGTPTPQAPTHDRVIPFALPCAPGALAFTVPGVDRIEDSVYLARGQAIAFSRPGPASAHEAGRSVTSGPRECRRRRSLVRYGASGRITDRPADARSSATVDFRKVGRSAGFRFPGGAANRCELRSDWSRNAVLGASSLAGLGGYSPLSLADRTATESRGLCQGQ